MSSTSMAPMMCYIHPNGAGGRVIFIGDGDGAQHFWGTEEHLPSREMICSAQLSGPFTYLLIESFEKSLPQRD